MFTVGEPDIDEGDGPIRDLTKMRRKREIVGEATRITTSPEMNPVTACARITFGKIREETRRNE